MQRYSVRPVPLYYQPLDGPPLPSLSLEETLVSPGGIPGYDLQERPQDCNDLLAYGSSEHGIPRCLGAQERGDSLLFIGSFASGLPRHFFA